MMANNVLTESLLEPLDGATAATVNIDTGDGNLTVDRLTGGAPVLATGTLQYFENQGHPVETYSASAGQATLTLKGGPAHRPWLHLPWAACNGAYQWQIHLNPTVAADITAHCDGGNCTLNLAGLTVTHVKADTGGGNMEVVLPDHAAHLDTTAKTGAGNVTVAVGSGITGANTLTAGSGAGNVVVHVPGDIPARIHATSGLGKVIMDSRFARLDAHTYQSPDYESAADKIEITAHSGAGNVSVDTP